MENIIVYTTANAYEVDIVRDAFKKANIPFYVQAEGFAGILGALEASPASGFNERWHILVPEQIQAEAKDILSNLHLTVDSDRKPFIEMDEATFKKSFWKALIWVSPIILFLVYHFIKELIGNH
jgi:Putative prokaryotic signal transducing protein